MNTIVEQDFEQLKYPKGRLFSQPDPSPEQVEGWLRELEALPGAVRAAVAGLTDAQLDTPYRSGGWTVRQLAHHLPDSHMNAYMRTQWTLTEDRPTIKPYDQDAWAQLPYPNSAPIADSLDLLDATHRRWTSVLRLLSDDQWKREYFHPEDQKYFTLHHLLQVYAWHSRHHLAHIVNARQRNGW